MIRNVDGDKCFEGHTEAMYLIGEWTYQILSWLKQLRDEYGIQLPMFVFYRSKIHDLAMVSKRYVADTKKREDFLLEKIRELSEDSLCPRCHGPKHPPKEE